MSEKEEYTNDGCRDLNTGEAGKILAGLTVTSTPV